MLMFPLPSRVWPLPICLDSWTCIPGSYATLLFTALDLASITSHIHNWVLFLFWLHPFILSGVISPLISSSILGTWGVPLLVFYHFALSYCSWGSQGKNTKVVCRSLLQWTMFCQNSQLWLIFIVQQKPTQHCKAIILQFKIKQNKIKTTSEHKHSNKIWKQPFLLSISTFVQHHLSSEAFQVEYWLSALAIYCLSL